MLAHNDAQQHLTAVPISQQRYLYWLLGAGQLMDAADTSVNWNVFGTGSKRHVMVERDSGLSKTQIMVPETSIDCCRTGPVWKEKQKKSTQFFCVNIFISEKECINFPLVSSLVLYGKSLIMWHPLQLLSRSFSGFWYSCHSSGWQLTTFSIF